MALLELCHPEGKQSISMIIPPGALTDDRLKMTVYVCDNAACGCSDITIDLSKTEEPTLQARFALDVFDKKINTANLRNNDLKMAEKFVSRIDDKDWAILHSVFAKRKIDCIENIDFTRTSAEFSNMKEIESNGELVPYLEIIPHGEKFILGEYAECILLDEQYCLRSGCDCDRVVVCFFNTKDYVSQGNSSMITVLYRTGKIDSVEPSEGFTQTPKELWLHFMEKYPDILNKFAKRHKQLAKLYSEYRRRTLPVATKKIETPGRNEPCPCGSGKKYKKCCIQ